jgi:small subunit ribosomal protein S9
MNFKQGRRNDNPEDDEPEGYTDGIYDSEKFDTAFDVTEEEEKEFLRDMEEEEKALDLSKHYEIGDVLPFISKNVAYEKTDKLIKLLKAKTYTSKMGAEEAESEITEEKEKPVYWARYNRANEKVEQSLFQQQLKEFPHTIYGDNHQGKFLLEQVEGAMEAITNEQHGIETVNREHVFNLLKDKELKAKREQEREDATTFSFLLNEEQEQKPIDPWDQKEYNAHKQEKIVSRVFKLIQNKLDTEKRNEAKVLYDKEIKEIMKSGKEEDYENNLVRENVVGEAKRISNLNDAKYGQIYTRSSKNVDMMSASASPASFPEEVLKSLNLEYLHQLQTDFQHETKLWKVFEPKNPIQRVNGLTDYDPEVDDPYKERREKENELQEENQIINDPTSYTHTESRYFLNDEHFHRKFENELNEDLKTKPLSEVYRTRPYLFIDPLAKTIADLNDISANDLASPFDRDHVQLLYKTILQGRPLNDVEDFFSSLREAGNREELLQRLQRLLPSIAPARIGSILDKIVDKLVEPKVYNALIEAKHYTGAKRSIMALSDFLNSSSQPSTMTIADMIAKPRPKIEAVMYAVEQISEGNVPAPTLLHVAQLSKSMHEHDFPTEWDYLYEILRPVHEYKKTSFDIERERKRYHPRIYSGIVRASGKRKTSIAHVKMTPGTGLFSINGRNYLDYFPDRVDLLTLGLPLRVTNSFHQFDIIAKVRGGGTTGQRDALKLAISKALGKFIPEFGYALAGHSMMTVDRRIVERKKFGLKKARKAPTYVRR